MPKLIPHLNPKDITNSGERLVAEALVQQLDPQVLLYHSFPWLRREDHGARSPLRPGEADFVIIDPQLGLLVLEVKGGVLQYQPEQYRYERVQENGKITVIQDPFEQGKKNLFAIRDLLLKHPHFRNLGSLPFPYGSAVVFPHCRFSGPLPANAKPELLIDAMGLQNIRPQIKKAMEGWNGSPIRQTMTKSDLDAVRECLHPVFQITPALWRTVEEQDGRLQRLTADQQALLDFLGHHQKAAIEGVAGSGKTILAMTQAQRFARAGLKTLLLCYNRPLADWLEQELPPQYAEQVSIHTYHGLCHHWCRKAGIPFNPREDGAFWADEAADLLENAAGMLPPEEKFQAVVVDEGQDFRPLWWLSLEQIFRNLDTDAYYVFFDPKQNIYIETPTLPMCLGNPFVLSKNCRNTRAIAEHCGNLLNIPIGVHDQAPCGEKPRILSASNRSEMIAMTAKQILEWCMPGHGGIIPSKVAILTASDPDKLSPPWPSDFKGVPVTKGVQNWRSGKGVLLESWRRFKGLEAVAIVIAGMNENLGEHSLTPADYYVACSRAKHLLTFINLAKN